MVLSLLLAGLAAAPLPAQPTYSVDPLAQRCYVSASDAQREPVTVKAHGFLGGAALQVFVDDILLTLDPPPVADANGDLVGTVPAPYVQSGQREFTVRVSDPIRQSNTASVTGKVTALSVEQVPARAASTNDKVRFRVRGFTSEGIVYAHYLFDGRSRKTVRIGKPYGPCGLVSRRLRQFPFKHPPAVGRWTIAFDQQERFAPVTPRRTNLQVVVTRKVKAQR